MRLAGKSKTTSQLRGSKSGYLVKDNILVGDKKNYSALFIWISILNGIFLIAGHLWAKNPDVKRKSAADAGMSPVV